MRRLIKYALTIAFAVQLTTITVQSDQVDTPEDKIGIWTRITQPDWLKAQALDKGFTIALETTQILTGLTEGYHYSQETKHIVTGDNYHAFDLARRTGWMITGWFEYANMRDENQTRFDKWRRFFGGALRARNRMEWAYKLQRYGNPFDYTKEHNQHAVVYVGFRDGKIKDLYIGTGPLSGPLADICFEILGALIHK